MEGSATRADKLESQIVTSNQFLFGKTLSTMFEQLFHYELHNPVVVVFPQQLCTNLNRFYKFG